MLRLYMDWWVFAAVFLVCLIVGFFIGRRRR